MTFNILLVYDSGGQCQGKLFGSGTYSKNPFEEARNLFTMLLLLVLSGGHLCP
jgi:hypothetical protein